MFSFNSPDTYEGDVPYYLAPNSDSANGASGSNGGGLGSLEQLMNNPWFRMGMAYNYAQQGLKSAQSSFDTATKNKLSYINSLSQNRSQVTTGGNVPAAQMQPWNPALIAQLIQMLAGGAQQ